ncbi:MAG: C25 family cysteine peptidase [Planctomycetota bacterium]
MKALGYASVGGNPEYSLIAKHGYGYRIRGVSTLKTPVKVEAVPEPLNPSALEAQYLVVTLDNLKAAGQLFADYHASQGLTTRVLTLSEVLDIANHGIYGPEALSRLAKESGAAYLLLLGDMTYDYFAIISDDVEHSLPAPLVVSQNMEAASDGPYAMARTYTGVPQVAIGRIPARTLEQAQVVLDKVKARAVQLAPTNAQMLISGGVEQSHNTAYFDGVCEDISSGLGGTTVKVYRDALGVTGARTLMMATWGQTASVLYAGHGSVGLWSGSKLLYKRLPSRNDVLLLPEQDAPPLVVQLTCMGNSAFLPNNLGEALLMEPKRGASAVVGTTGMIAPEGQSLLGKRLLQYVAAGQRIGDAYRLAIGDMLKAGHDLQVVEGFTLLGDPASK